MNQVVYILISILFSIYILVELFRINILKKKNNILLLGLISLLSLGFGLILVIKFGLIIDYAKVDLHEMEQAIFLNGLGWLNVWLGLFSVGLSILKFILFRIRNWNQ